MTSQTMFPQMPIAREFIRPRQHHTWSIAIPVISAMTSATAIMPQKHRAELESLNLEHHLLGRPKVARAPKRTRLAAELSSQLLLVQLVRNGSVNARSSRNATKPWRRIVIPTSRELPNSRLKFKPCVTVVQSICARKMNSCAWKFASTRPSFAVLSAPHELSLNSPARSSTALCVAEVTVPLARLLALRTQVQLITHGIGLNTMHSTIWELVALLSSVCRCSPEDATLQTKNASMCVSTCRGVPRACMIFANASGRHGLLQTSTSGPILVPGRTMPRSQLQRFPQVLKNFKPLMMLSFASSTTLRTTVSTTKLMRKSPHAIAHLCSHGNTPNSLLRHLSPKTQRARNSEDRTMALPSALHTTTPQCPRLQRLLKR
mmetsp:Transcript_13791/g.24679  ORF Transcript_13791/g.24679 Transcript_13791/m.24679 type:complete len:376 (+) Transcript_13791:828-1955(+)